MAIKETLNSLSVDDRAMTLDDTYIIRVDILKIVAILLGITRDTVNGKSMRHVKKIMEKIYQDVLEDTNKSDRIRKHIWLVLLMK